MKMIIKWFVLVFLIVCVKPCMAQRAVFLSQNVRQPSFTASAGTNCTAVTPGGGTASSMSCALTATAGDTIVVFPNTPAQTPTSVVDSAGATSVLIYSPSTSHFAYYFQNVTAGSHTITVNMASAVTNGFPTLQVFDVKGAPTTGSPIDAFSYFPTGVSTTAVVSAPVTTTFTNDLLIGETQACIGGGAEAFTAGSPAFTLSAGSWADQNGGTFLAATPNTYTFRETAGTPWGWCTWLIAVK
jgi:hypothetical protein